MNNDRSLRASVTAYRDELVRKFPDYVRRSEVVHILGMMLEVTSEPSVLEQVQALIDKIDKPVVVVDERAASGEDRGQAMNQKPTINVTVENALTLTEADYLRVVEVQGETFTSLGHSEQYLRAAFPTWFIYRGGHHVSLHEGSGHPRVLLVEERDFNKLQERGNRS